jgi:uncharacterized protein YdaU (DUF1376 family)
MAKKQKAPAFQFYVRDYETDENVKMMDLEHEGAYLRLMCNQWMEGSIPSDMGALAKICRISTVKMRRLWPLLEPCFHVSEENEGRLVNLRLLEQKQELEEYVEEARELGKLGAQKRWGKDRGPMPTPSENGKGDGSSASATATASAKEYSADFLTAWAEYPARVGGSDKKGAYKAWRARLAGGHSPEAMTAGAKRYARFCFDTGRLGTEYVKDAKTFFGPSEHFTNEWVSPDPASKHKGGAPGSESESARAKETTYQPPAPGPRTGLTRIDGTPEPNAAAERAERVAAWEQNNPAEAKRLRAQCRATAETALKGYSENAIGNMADQSFMHAVLDLLKPKIADVA